MSVLFVTYGPTHSGKTTFAKRLKETLGESAKFIRVDNDEVDEFIKEKFLNLRNDPEVLSRRTPTDPDLRLLIPQLIAGYALREGYSDITTAAHPKRSIREAYRNIARDNDAKVVLIMFNIDETEVLRRIQQTKRDDHILDVSAHGGSDFADLYEKQKQVLEVPSAEEKALYDQVLVVTSDNVDAMLQQAVDYFHQYQTA